MIGCVSGLRALLVSVSLLLWFSVYSVCQPLSPISSIVLPLCLQPFLPDKSPFVRRGVWHCGRVLRANTEALVLNAVLTPETSAACLSPLSTPLPVYLLWENNKK
ncbi:hypothetical protein ATANTOWER_013193 [Ataeniobius toweri]|uniref:Secreted protein n=1 Tax=Ataeniobius toweri TaxID=208326 RepID=A0ABU7BHD4_9TELE|nr:hypothetical protein [Ataeniobius toweri]